MIENMPVRSSAGAARLRDGTLVRIRRVEAADQDEVLEFLGRVTPESLELRFFARVRPEIVATEILAPAEPGDRASLIVESADPGTSPSILGHGEYLRSRIHPEQAEVAFLVADDHHGQGIATLLLWSLARSARARGILQFDAFTLPENRAMIDVFLCAGFPCQLHYKDGLELVALDIHREPDIGIVPTGISDLSLRLRA
jgi:GNAT superfamily N-acetyltransferase